MSKPCTAVLNLLSRDCAYRNLVSVKNFTAQSYGASFDLIDNDGEKYFCLVVPKQFMLDHVMMIHRKDEININEENKTIEVKKNRIKGWL